MHAFETARLVVKSNGFDGREVSFNISDETDHRLYRGLFHRKNFILKTLLLLSSEIQIFSCE